MDNFSNIDTGISSLGGSPAAAPAPIAPAMQPPQAANLPAMPDTGTQPQQPTGHSRLINGIKALLGGMLEGAAGSAGARNPGQAFGMGVRGVDAAQQRQLENQRQAQQDKQAQQLEDDRHTLFLANMQKSNLELYVQQRQLRNLNSEDMQNLAKLGQDQLTFAKSVYGTDMDQQTVRQKYMELHQQNPNSAVVYTPTGVRLNPDGSTVQTYTLYEPGTDMVTVSPEAMQTLKSSGIVIPSAIREGAQVPQALLSTTLHNAQVQYVANLNQKQKESDAAKAQSQATTAAANAAVATPEAQAGLEAKQAGAQKAKADAQIEQTKAKYADQQQRVEIAVKQGQADKMKGDDSPVYAYDPGTKQTILTTKGQASDRNLQGIRKVGQKDIDKDTHDTKVLNDIAVKSNNVTAAARAMDSKSWLQAVGVAKYLADHKATTLEGLTNSGIIGALNPAAQHYVIAIMSLREAALGLQKVLTGTARQNESQLKALQNTLPGVEPNARIVNEKMDAFTQNIQMLRQGIPQLPGIEVVKITQANTNAQPTHAVIVNGKVIGYTSDGKTMTPVQQ